MKRTALRRKAPLKQTASPRKSPPGLRTSALRARKPLRQVSAKARARKAQEALEPGREAWKAPRWGACANCGVPGPLVLHHVVEANWLRRHGFPPYGDLRNGMPLGAPLPFGGRCFCHSRHTDAFERIPLAKLPVDAVAFAYQLLGAYAGDYLARLYQPTN